MADRGRGHPAGGREPPFDYRSTTPFDYRTTEGAGHGVVLTSAGEVLTKMHLMYGATQMQGRLPPDGRSPQSSLRSATDVALRRVWSVSAGEHPTESGEFASDGANDAIRCS